MNILTAVGRYFFGFALVASGAQQLFRAEFVRLVPPGPNWVAEHAILPVMVGILLILAGAAIVIGKMARLASALVGLMLLSLLLFLYVPEIAKNPMAGFVWTNPCKVLALIGGAILLIGIMPAHETDRFAPAVATMERLKRISPFLVCIFFVVGGIQHFVYAGFVDTLVPAWIPPSQRFWTYFAGVALIAGGLGLIIPRVARCAAIASGVMIFLWVVLLHIPRALADLQKPGETSGVFEALALSGVAFLIAGTRQTKTFPRPQSRL